MSANIKSIPVNGKLYNVTEKIRFLSLRYPEWRTCSLSLLMWGVLVLNLPAISHETAYPGSTVYCLPTEVLQNGEHTSFEIQNNLEELFSSSRLLKTVSNGLIPWIIMVVAMMFPLLNESVRHVAFSIRRKNRDFGILCFLTGYTVIWTAAGVFFLLLPLFSTLLFRNQSQLIIGLIKGSGFLFAGILIWHPSRLLKMAKCSQTMPIRIQGWQLYYDCLAYGLKIGSVCLKMCWPPMLALMLAHHDIILMYFATIVILSERYLLPHSDKFPGYAWFTTALIVFGIEIWN